jgi:hypothetical protein
VSAGWDAVVRVSSTADGDQEDVAILVGRLRAELLDLDVDAVEPASAESVPDGAKSAAGLAGMLTLRLGRAGLKAVFAKLRDWVARNGRSVEVTIDGDTVKVTGATLEQQERLINVWLARHAPGS